VLESKNMYCIQWNVDSLDWKEISADEITDKVVNKVTNGSIVLFHNAALHTPEALPEIIETLQSKGYEFVKISDLIIKENYEIDHEGKQISTDIDKDSTSNLEN
jgi:peptidoglycan/xylan/chitin deacetylase (PgdA/CDA1 family)